MHLNKTHFRYFRYIHTLNRDGIVSDLRCATSYLFSLLRSSDTIKSQSLEIKVLRASGLLVFS